MALPWESEEKRNYICMNFIFNDIVSKELRKIFKQEWNNLYQASFGAWDDTKMSGQQLFHLEKTRSRPNKDVYQSKFLHGDTNQWNCSVLFDAILYSNSIGKANLDPTKLAEVDNIRKLRNEIIFTDGKLSDLDFQTKISEVERTFKALELPINDVIRIKYENSRYKSFQVLPVQPSHDVIIRDSLVSEITKDLQKLRSDSDSKLTYFYISGNPGCGKTQLSRQVCENLYLKYASGQMETMFIMTLKAKDLNCLLYSYEDFCRRLNCDQGVLLNIVNSTKLNVDKIEELRSLIAKRIKCWERWLLIVDGVENVVEISPLLPQVGEEVWNNGQIIITTQDTMSIPADSLFTKHISLSAGMEKKECHQLLSLLSLTDANNPFLDEVAEQLDRQPLALAAAAIYLRRIEESSFSKQFSWQDYLEKLKHGKRIITEQALREINLAYPFTMSSAVLLSVEKCAENLILNHAFHFFSFVSFQSLPLIIVVKYIQQLEQDLDTEDICLTIQQCSLFLPTELDSQNISLHRVVHEAIKIFCADCKRPNVGEVPLVRSRSDRPRIDIESKVKNVVRTLYLFKDRDDKMKLIPHLKEFNRAAKTLCPEQDALIAIISLFDKTEIFGIFLFFGKTLRQHCEYLLSLNFYLALHEALHEGLNEDNPLVFGCIYNELGLTYQALRLWEKATCYIQKGHLIRKEQLGPNHVDVANSNDNLGLLYHDTGELDKAKDYMQRGLEIRIELLGQHVDVAKSYDNIGSLYLDLGDLDKAKDCIQRGLEIRMILLGPNHVDVAKSCDNIGSFYRDIGDLDKAKDYMQRGLEIRMTLLGPNHVDLAKYYDNIGSFYRDIGDLDKAKYYMQRGLEIRVTLLAPNHVDVAKSYDNIGSLCRDIGELAKAKLYLERGLEIRMTLLGPNHVDVAKSYEHLGSLYRDTGELDKAKDKMQRGLEIRMKLLGPHHVDVAKS